MGKPHPKTKQPLIQADDREQPDAAFNQHFADGPETSSAARDSGRIEVFAGY